MTHRMMSLVVLSDWLLIFFYRKHSDGLGEIGFVRYAYADGLTLMPGPDT